MIRSRMVHPCILLTTTLLITAASAGEPASAPASRPDDAVLVRIGDRESVTQREFERAMGWLRADQVDGVKDTRIRELVTDKLLLLYIKDHNLVSDELVQAEVRNAMERAGVKTREEFGRKLEAAGRLYQDYIRIRTVQLGLAELTRRGGAAAQKEDNLRALWNADPSAFDGTRVAARHILISAAPYHTPEEKAARRARAQKIVDELSDGRRSWEECIEESEDLVTKPVGGSLGKFVRHEAILEPIAAAAFSLAVGERSGVVETPLGFHVIEVLERIPGNRTFEHSDAQRDMKIWMERAAFVDALEEARKNHKVVGVRAPAPFTPPPPPVRTRPALDMSVLTRRPPATSPAGPATRPSPATRPLRPGRR